MGSWDVMAWMRKPKTMGEALKAIYAWLPHILVLGKQF